jgi:hypothetical protein
VDFSINPARAYRGSSARFRRLVARHRQQARSLRTHAHPAIVLDVLTPPAGCTISEGEPAAQRERVHARAPFVTAAARANGVLTMTFVDEIDRSLIHQLITVEERCRPFLGFAYDEATLNLTIIANAEHEDALDHFLPHRDS